ncbi:hypothetical protein HPY86_08520 [candidate division WOR-3 bacterium]|nr:hypothetical protein [candidate division WOR-3 bacterium]
MRGLFFASGHRTQTTLSGLLLVIVGLGFLNAAPPSEGGGWVERFSIWHSVNEMRALRSPNSANLAWFEAPILRSYLYLFSATGDTLWLERFVFHADSLLRLMRDVPEQGNYWLGYQDGFLGWGTTAYDPQGRYQEYLVHDAVICLPLARFVRMVYETPGLRHEFLERAQVYQRAIEQQVLAKWFQNWAAARGTGEELEHFGGWSRLPWNQALSMGELLMVFRDIQRTQFYQPGKFSVPGWFYEDVPDSMARAFYASLILSLENDCYVWNHQASSSRWEDVAHANLDISFALEAGANESIFEERDFQRMGRSLWKLVQDRHSDRFVLRRFVNGSGTVDTVYALEMWAALAKFEPEVWEVVSTALVSVPVERMNVSMAVSCARLALESSGAERGTEKRQGVEANEPGRVPWGAILFSRSPEFEEVFDAAGRRVRWQKQGRLGSGLYFTSSGRRVLVLP